ncbi:uncharacterized protein DUF4397 [Frondihabitans sp. PhB188]|uniref:DUF4397 domain-containing protein n=1 Tax=Frondihabitans sp. PhB188 TaxID=2485200 RepID=UPI000F499B12|nr:DUF4397 domain-containing protein [Frondihabitans sp. PhB188]ROQ38361.1 uncharacterized protein DUF4397 [Frondihabitans sp. PhB188]
MATLIHSSRSPQSAPRDEAKRLVRLQRVAIVLALFVAAALALGSALFGGSSADAAPAAGKGWVRVGHLSPDTKAVDVRLTAFAGGQTVYELDGVKYGQVSPYKQLPTGRYTVAMTASDAPKSAKPVISASITVATDKPITVVAYGTNDDLQTNVFQDDLTKPAADKARVRLVQAATVSKTVSVATSTGTAIAEDAAFGSASGYASVGAGTWKLDLDGRDKKAEATKTLKLASGSINTLFVLDNASNGITIVPVVDSAATTTTPKGGVQTGGGYEATHPELIPTALPFEAVAP